MMPHDPPESSTSLVTATPQLGEVEQLAAAAKAYVEQGRAPGTRRTYGANWERFRVWAVEAGLPHLPAPPETICLYAAHLAREGLRPCSIQLALTAIAWKHKQQGMDNPTGDQLVHAVVAGIKRALGTKKQHKQALIAALVRQMVEPIACDHHIVHHRDHALLLLGFSGAFRRSEVCTLEVSDLRFVPQGLEVTLRRSKTDQRGKGTVKAIPFASDKDFCPVRSLQRWLWSAGIESGPIFRRIDRWGFIGTKALEPGTLARIIKKHALAAGLDPAQFSGHSLRSGWITSAHELGKGLQATMEHAGHTSLQQHMEYVQRVNLWKNNPGDGLL